MLKDLASCNVASIYHITFSLRQPEQLSRCLFFPFFLTKVDICITLGKMLAKEVLCAHFEVTLLLFPRHIIIIFSLKTCSFQCDRFAPTIG